MVMIFRFDGCIFMFRQIHAVDTTGWAPLDGTMYVVIV